MSNANYLIVTAFGGGVNPRHWLILLGLVGVGDSFLDKHMNVSNDVRTFVRSNSQHAGLFPAGVVLFVFYGEFDPGSGRTLAACLTHASRTMKPSLLGGRVANG